MKMFVIRFIIELWHCLIGFLVSKVKITKFLSDRKECEML